MSEIGTVGASDRVVTIDPEFQLSVLRWGQDFYVDLVDNDVEQWVHTPNSPCEPLIIKLTSNLNGSFLSREFHPLTAVATDDELEIRLEP